jgi:hypothetical protein
MKFTSLQEYFYKLQNLLFVLILMPLVVFVCLFINAPATTFSSGIMQPDLVANLLMIVVVFEWVAMTFLFRKKVLLLSKAVALSTKLDGYYNITIVRFSVGVASCLLLAGGFYITKNSFFIAVFGCLIILLFTVWPRPAKVCRDLRLKGDELEMVRYKRHSL